MTVFKTAILRLLCTFALTSAAQAQDLPPSIPFIKVSPSKPTSVSTLKRMPHGTETHFFGTARSVYGLPNLALHVYSDQTEDSDHTEALDLFTWQRTKNGRVMRRLNSVHFFDQDGEEVGVNLLWLYPRTKHIPVVEIDFRGRGIEGPYGSTIFVVFPEGIKGKAVTQKFEYGGSNGSDHEGWGWSFNGTDHDGFLKIESDFGDKHQYESIDWRWNGHAWVVVKNEIRKLPV